MGHSFLEYKKELLRIHDTMIMIPFLIVIKTGVNKYANDEKLVSMFHKWDEQLKYTGPGLISLDLDGFWETERGNQILFELLELTRKHIQDFGDYVPATYLNNLGQGYLKFLGDLETSMILDDLEKIIQLINR